MRNLLLVALVSVLVGGCGSDRIRPPADGAVPDGGTRDANTGDAAPDAATTDAEVSDDLGGGEDAATDVDLGVDLGVDAGPECVAADTCPGSDTECATRTCVGGVCGMSFQPDGTVLGVQIAGDCRQDVCDGVGGIRSSNDDADVPTADACRVASCDAGTPQMALAVVGTACGAAGFCDASGTCVACLSAATCPGITDECGAPACVTGACGRSFTASGVAVASQVAGDCGRRVCDGTGGIRRDVDNADLPAIISECAVGACAAGMATTAPRAAGISCSTGVCNGAGTCVACISDAQCGAGICVSNACATLLISEVQTRGDAVGGAGNDEFIEIYNAGTAAVTIDMNWTIRARSSTSMTNGTRFTGTGQVIPSHGHLLVVGTGYDGVAAADGALTAGITDAGSVSLLFGARVVDALCFAYDPSSLTAVSDPGFVCEGTPASNLPHNNTSSVASNTDVSLERRPGGAAGSGTDTGNSLADFLNGASTPQNVSSPRTP